MPFVKDWGIMYHKNMEKNLGKRSLIFLGIEWSLEFLKGVVIVALLALALRIFVVEPFGVVGQSMEPNYHDKDYLVIDKISYRFRDPHRGEVVIFHPKPAPEESYIKRIIGLPGETVEVKDGMVYVNSRRLSEPYVISDSKMPLERDYPAVTLGNDEYFMFGDNRDHSSDSREIGPVPKVNIQGRVAVVLLPVSSFQFPKTPSYGNAMSRALPN